MSNDPIRIITVRLPKSLHDAVMTAVYTSGDRDSMNKYCIRAIQHELEPQKRSDDLLIRVLQCAAELSDQDYAKLIDLLVEVNACKSLEDRAQAGQEILQLVMPEQYAVQEANNVPEMS